MISKFHLRRYCILDASLLLNKRPKRSLNLMDIFCTFYNYFFFSILSWKFCLRRYQIYLSLKLTSGPLEFMKFGQICYSVFKNLTTALLLFMIVLEVVGNSNRILEFWLPRDQYIPGAQKAYELRTL